MAQSTCVHCGNEFTYLTPEEYLLGQYKDDQILLLKQYLLDFTEAGFRYRCEKQESARNIRDDLFAKIKDIIRETIKEVKNSPAGDKIEKYCFHIADHVISLIIETSPGLLLMLSKRTTLNFQELDIDNKNSIASNLFFRFNYSMFPIYCSLGLNYRELVKYHYNLKSFYLFPNAIYCRDEMLVKYLIAYGINISAHDMYLVKNWKPMKKYFDQILGLCDTSDKDEYDNNIKTTEQN